MSKEMSFQLSDLERFINFSEGYWCLIDDKGQVISSNNTLKNLLPKDSNALPGVEKSDNTLKNVLQKVVRSGHEAQFRSQFKLDKDTIDIQWTLIPTSVENIFLARGIVFSEGSQREKESLHQAFDQLRNTLNNNSFEGDELADIQNVLSDKIDKFKLISQNVSDIVCLHEPKDARYLYVSPSLEEVTGYEPHEFVGKSPYDFFHPDMQKQLQEDHEKKQHGEEHDEGPPPKMLYKILSKQGGYIWLESHSRPIFDENGNVIMILSTSRDVTERVDAEMEKEKYFQYYRILGNNIPNGAVFLVDHNYRFIIAEGQEFEKLKRNPDYYLNKTIDEVYPQDRLEFLRPYFKTVIDKKEKVKFEYQHEGYDYTFWGTPYIDNHGDLVCGIFLTQNITESKQIERQLRNTIHELEFQKSALDASALVTIINPDGVITYVNRRFCKISGYSRKELIGNKLSIVNSGFHPDKFFKDMKTKMMKGDVWHGEIKNRAKSGEMFWVDTYVVPFKNEAGEIVKYVYIRFDITDRKKAEEELQAKNYELDAFAYHTSHDLRAPLSSIIGLTTLINNESSIEGIKYYNALIRSSVKKLDNFITSVMSHSRNQKQEVTIELIPFEQIIKEVLEELQFNGNYDHLIVKQSIDDNHNFYTDIVRLTIILKNLLANSIKYANTMRNDGMIQIEVKTDENRATLAIEDNGIGIRNEYLSKVFDMFYRANNRTEGSGLGLYIVKQTVDKLKGKIEIHSEYGGGTRVFVELPNLK